MSEQLTPQEAENALIFLDRVAVTGHRERYAMNIVVQKLSAMVPQEYLQQKNQDTAAAEEQPPAPAPKKRAPRRKKA